MSSISFTFKATEDFILSSIDVIFNLKNKYGQNLHDGSTFLLPDNVKVFVTKVTAGYPDSNNTLGIGIAEIGTLVSNVNPLKVYFKNRIKLTKNISYAIYFESTGTVKARNVSTNPTLKKYDGYSIMLRTAKLSEINLNPNSAEYNTIINQQPYIDGVFLQSSNANTWVPIQDEDMYFKINAPIYNNTKTYIKNISGIDPNKNYTDLVLNINNNIPHDTSINYKYNMNSVINNIVNKDLNYINNKITSLDIIGDMSTSNTSTTPSILGGDIHLGVLNNKGVYCTKNIDLNKNNYPVQKNLVIYLDAIEYWNINNIKIYYTTDILINSNSWIEVPYDSDGYSTDKYTEKVYIKNNITVDNSFRLKIELYKDLNPYNRIRISNLRITLK